jgi:hypothetical protein
MAEGPVPILSEYPGGTPVRQAGGAGSCAFRSNNPAAPVGGKTPRYGDNEHGMQVQVETYVDEVGAEKLRRFRLDSRVIEVADNIDQWHGADYRYVKVSSSDGNIYILRHSEIRAEWELTMYQRTQSQDGRTRNLHMDRSVRTKVRL